MAEDINQFYRDHFKVDFSKLKPEQQQTYDQIIGQLQSPPMVIINGRPTQNPAIAAITQHAGWDAKVARNLAVYAAWRSGQMADPTVDRARLKQAGVPDDKIAQYEKEKPEQVNEWKAGVLNKFAHLVPQDAATAERGKPALEMPAETITADKQLTDPMSNPATTPPPQSAPAPSGSQGAPAPAPESAPASQPASMPEEELPQPLTGQPWQKQKLVNGQYVPMEGENG